MLTANQKRQVIRNAAIFALKAQGKTCEALTGKPVVSALTNQELRQLCAVLQIDIDDFIATAEAAAMAGETIPEDDDAPAAPAAAPDAPAATPSPDKRAWQALAPLHGLKGFIADSALDALIDNVAGVFAQLDKCQQDLADAKDAPPLAAIARPAEGEDATPSLTSYKASKIFGVKTPTLEALALPVWNSPDAPDRDPFYLFDPVLLEDLSLCVAERSYPWLAGPKGTGKTSAAMQLAAALGRPFFRIAFNEFTEPRDLLGGDGLENGATVWKDGPLTKALRTPGAIILFDEPSIARPGSLAALQTILDHGFVLLESGEKVSVAQDVVFMAADNTAGRGDESGHYAGTRAMNVAFLDRFSVVLNVDHPAPELEAKALADRTGAPQGVADLVVAFAGKTRQKCETGDLTEGLGFRRLAAFTRRLVAGVPVDRAFKTAVLNAAHQEDRAALGVIAAADLDASRIAQIIAGLPDATPDATGDMEAPVYKDPRNARAARDFDAI